jgi:hypothetical protein
MCALFATSVNLNFYKWQKFLFKRLDELYRLVPHLTLVDVGYWSYGHYSLDGQDGRKKKVSIFFNFFCFYSKSTLKKTISAKRILIYRDMTLQWYILLKK